MALFSVINSFRQSLRTGDTAGVAAAAAAAGFVLASRWGETTALRQRITSIETGLVVTTGFTAAQLVGYDLVVGRVYTANSTGGTAAALTTSNGKMRVAADVSKLTDLRVALAVALGAGTVTPDTALLGQDAVWALAATAGAKIQKAYDFTDTELGGLVLQRDEGVIMRNLIAQGAAGTVQFFATIAWDEGTLG